MSSRPLLTSVALLIVMTGPMFQVGCARACSGVTPASSALVRCRNGPPLAVTISRLTSASRPPRRHWAIAECSESTGTIWPGAAASATSGPPMMSDSLLASASMRPAVRADRVAASPTAPVTAFRTTSHGCAAIPATASGPAVTSGSFRRAPPADAMAASASRSSGTAAGLATATLSAPSSMAWRASRPGFPPPAAIPVSRKRSGLRLMMSAACVPIEPVDPSTMMSRHWPALLADSTGLLSMARQARAACPASGRISDLACLREAAPASVACAREPVSREPQPPRRPAARVAGSCPGRAGRRRARHDAAAGIRRRVRPAAGPAGRSHQGRGIRPAGRRLRRDVRRRERRRGQGEAADNPADGRRPDLRREHPGRQDRPARRPVREATITGDGGQGRRRVAGLPRRRSQRVRLHPGVPRARPGPDAARLPLRRRDAQSLPGLHHRRVRRPPSGPRLEPGLRQEQPVRAALRAAGGRDRPGAVLHARVRRGLR